MSVDMKKVDAVYEAAAHLLRNTMKGMATKPHMMCYTAIYNYLSKAYENEGEKLYHKYEKMIDVYLDELSGASKKLEGEALLTFYSSKWNEFTLANRSINHILHYLNRTWIQSNSSVNENVHPIMQFGDLLWKKKLFRQIAPRLTSTLMKLIGQVRNNMEIKTDLVSHTVDCYLKLSNNNDLYIEFFQRDFLEETRKFYVAESAQAATDVCAYLQYIEDRIATEKLRAERYHYSCSLTELEKILNEVLIIDHLDFILCSIDWLLENDKRQDLDRMYFVLSRVEKERGILLYVERFNQNVEKTGLAMVASSMPNQPDTFVNIMLEIYRRYHSYVHETFRGDKLFATAMDKAFQIVVNENAVTQQNQEQNQENALAVAPQFLSRYCDQVLKKGGSHSSAGEEEMEKVLDELVELFKYISDKDIFIISYQKLMAKRLINDQSVSDSAEAVVINKLRTHQGFEFCSKLQRMLQDIEVSRDTDSRFLEQCQNNAVDFGFSFSIKVLAHGMWPIPAPTGDCILPSELTAAMTTFNEYYKGVKSGRKLIYLHQLSKIQLRSNCQMKGRLNLQASTYQAVVLMLFNKQDVLTYAFMKQASKIEEISLKIALLGLLKVEVILCDKGDAHEDWDDETAFRINTNLKTKRLALSCNVPVNTATLKSNPTPQVDAPEVKQERNFKIRAAIVRILKGRQTISHNELIAEVIDQVAKLFKPTMSMIKDGIEYCIEEEYMARMEDSDGKPLKKYSYIA